MTSNISPLLGDPNAPGVYRIVIHGNSGTGKSTLSRKLSTILKIPVIHLDEVHWKPNWVSSSGEEMVQDLTKRFEETESWIVEGNYESKLKRFVDERATDIIWLDPPFWKYFPRAVTRTFRRLLRREDTCAPGCNETWRECFFSGDSILLWVWSHHDIARERYGPRWAEGSITKGGIWRRLEDIDEHEVWLEQVEAFVKSR